MDDGILRLRLALYSLSDQRRCRSALQKVTQFWRDTLAEVSFGEWLKRQRKARGLTQEQLARQISCSTSALRKIEAQERRPSEQIIQQLAEVFQIASQERASFLKFARGNWDAAPTGGMESAPWRISHSKIQIATFIFTDIEASSRLWESAPEKMKSALQRHHAILQQAISSNGGDVFQIVGDAFCAVFPTAPAAVSAAVAAQRALYREPWDLPFPIRVRMGIHTGEAELTSNDSPTGGYASNPTLNRVARIHSVGHGGQVLLSLVTKELVKHSLPADTELHDMGDHHFKYLINPEHLFQLNIAGLPSDFPPLNTPDSVRHNLPVQLTSFIGRRQEIEEVIRLLEKTRMLTLIGPGGTGKTRLSMEVANEVLLQYPDGVWLVELAPISDPLLLPQTAARAIGLRDEPHRPVIDMLCDYLYDKQLLLLLDNCEHLVEACAQLADRLLHACPQLRILASSREALGISGEKLYLVPSLQLPDLQSSLTVETINQYEAVRLFTERASAVTQKFRLTDENAFSIAQICHRLDGMPLAIELAAGKMRSLSPQQIAQRLDDRFRLLTGGSRTALPRHQTLYATIEWSFNLLSDPEQILFRRLSVFVNGWTLAAAESVCSDEDTTAKDALKREDILELLSQLVNKSLVMAEERNDTMRYHMLETIRQHAHEELGKLPEGDRVRSSHMEFYVELAEEAESRLLGTDQLIWLGRLEQDLDNLRAALDWSSKQEHIVAGLRLAGALWRFWDVRSHWNEGRERITTLLSHPQAAARTRERAKALYTAGILAQIQTDHASAGPLFLEGLAISRELKDKRAIGYFLVGLARTWQRYRGNQEAGSLLDESLEIFRGLGDRWGLAAALEGQARDASDRDDLATANSCRTESIAIYRELGDTISLASSLSGLAFVMLSQGNYEQSAARYAEALKIFREIGHKWGIASALRTLGEVARCQGDYDRAKLQYEESLELSLEIGDKHLIAAALHNLGYVSQHQGNYSQMAALFRQCLVISQEVKDMVLSALCLAGLAGEAQANRRPERAAHLFGAVEAFFTFVHYHHFAPADRMEYVRNLDATRAQLNAEAFSAAWEKGQAMTLQEAITHALEE